MSGSALSRVHYSEGQYLGADDFNDEQAYHIDQLRRHLIGLHRWGIGHGLELVVDPDGRLLVTPGVAVDGYGRQLCLAAPRLIPPEAFTDRGAESLDVWLVWRQIESATGPAPSAADGMPAPPRAARIEEEPALTFTLPDPTETDRRQPASVPESDRSFGPERPPPDADRRWPVFLGRVTHDPRNVEKPFVPDPRGRPYVGLVAERIDAASGRAWLRLGVEHSPEEAGDGDRRFAVFVPESETDPTRLEPRLAVDASGHTTVRGDLSLAGDLALIRGALAFAAPDAAAENAAPNPWRVYRRSSVDGEEQLRFEMPESGTAQSVQFVIGAWSEGSFNPVLTIDANRTVTVHGNLVYKTKTGGSAPRAGIDPPLNPEAQRFLAATFLSGIGAGGGGIASAVAGTGPDAGPGLGLSAQVLAAAFAQAMTGASSDYLQAFATTLKQANSTLAGTLADLLKDSTDGGQGPD